MPKLCIPDAVAPPSSQTAPFLLSGPTSADGPAVWLLGAVSTGGHSFAAPLRSCC